VWDAVKRGREGGQRESKENFVKEPSGNQKKNLEESRVQGRKEGWDGVQRWEVENNYCVEEKKK